MLEQGVAIGIAVELVGGMGPKGPTFGQRAFLNRLYDLHRAIGGVGVVEAFRKARLVLGEPERDDADIENPRPRVSPLERLAQHFPVVLVGHENDLRVELDAGGKQAVEYLDAMGGVLADDAAAHLGVRGVQRHAQRADALLDDARLVFSGEVREGDERARKEAQAEIVVAQREGCPHVVGKLAHEAEGAGIAALLHAVEHHAFKLEAPVLALVAEKVDLPSLAVEVDVSHRDLVFGGKPTPIDQVAHRLAVDRGDEAAGFESCVVGRAFGGNVRNFGAGRELFASTRTCRARIARSFAIDVFRGVYRHPRIPFPCSRKERAFDAFPEAACSLGNCSMLNENRRHGNNPTQSTQAESGQGHKTLIPGRGFPSLASLGVSHS